IRNRLGLGVATTHRVQRYLPAVVEYTVVRGRFGETQWLLEGHGSRRPAEGRMRWHPVVAELCLYRIRSGRESEHLPSFAATHVDRSQDPSGPGRRDESYDCV